MQYKPLQEVITLQRGFDLPTVRRNGGPIPVIGATGVVGWHDESKVDGPVVTTGRSGVVGGSHWSRNAAWPLNTSMYVKDFKGNNPRFIYYALKTIDFTGFDSGSAQPSLNRNYIANLSFPCPLKEEQEYIAGILGSVDDKIEANSRLIDSLLELALIVFSSAKSRNETKVLDTLFKDFVGGDWGKEENDGSLFPVYEIRGADIPNLQKGGIGKLPLRYIKESSLKRRSLEPGDVVVEGSGGSPTQCTGRPALITQELIDNYDYPLVATNFCKIIKPMNQELGKSVYLGILDSWNSGELWQYETGTTGIKNLNFSLFASVKQIPDFDDSKYNLDLLAQIGQENSELMKIRGFLIRYLIG